MDFLHAGSTRSAAWSEFHSLDVMKTSSRSSVVLRRDANEGYDAIIRQ